uniref:Uncharacterized protein n=1 Tax=Enterococcus avium TaxID=33945 RepID=A0A286KC87_ENTAV|nr:hypothetical protein pEA19081_p34 [Enterococcus avium]
MKNYASRKFIHLKPIKELSMNGNEYLLQIIICKRYSYRWDSDEEYAGFSIN